MKLSTVCMLTVTAGLLMGRAVGAGAQQPVQVSVTNTLEEQVGNLPDRDPADLASTYNQLNAGLYFRNLEVGARAEYFNSSYAQPHYDFLPVTQRYVRWQGSRPDGEATACSVPGLRVLHTPARKTH